VSEEAKQDESGGDSGAGQARNGSPIRWIVLAVLLVAGLWFGVQALRQAEPAGGSAASSGEGSQAPPPATVIAAAVESKLVQERHRVTGTLRAAQRSEVAAQEPGAVETVEVDVGDRVEKGDRLVSLDARRLEAQLAEAKSRLAGAGAVVTQRTAEASRAARDLEMKRGLLSERAVSEREFLDAEREASVADARKKAAEDERAALASQLELLQVRLEDLDVRAPFPGRVVERHVDPGEWLAGGEPVVTLVSDGVVEAWLSVPERFIAEVGEGGRDLRIAADASGIASTARSVRIVGDVDPTSRLFPVVAEIDDRKGALAPGLSVHAELPVGDTRRLLAVRVDAVIETFEGASVFRVSAGEEGGMPVGERASVEVEFRRDGMAYLRSDALEAGDQVVVEGNERLFPGTPLVVGEPSGSPGEAASADEVKP